MAWSIGANDVANAMGTSVGSGAFTLRPALVLAAIFEFSGAFFFGSRVTETVQSGILLPELFTITRNYMSMACCQRSFLQELGCKWPPISVGPSRQPMPSLGLLLALVSWLEELGQSTGMLSP